MLLAPSPTIEEFALGDSSPPHVQVLQVVWRRINADRHYRFYFRDLDCHFSDGVLTLLGRVPTFHLKQVLQTLLRGIDGVSRIDNRVAVINAGGLSSDGLSSDER